jgi:hypothetical protein
VGEALEIQVSSHTTDNPANLKCIKNINARNRKFLVLVFSSNPAAFSCIGRRILIIRRAFVTYGRHHE